MSDVKRTSSACYRRSGWGVQILRTRLSQPPGGYRLMHMVTTRRSSAGLMFVLLCTAALAQSLPSASRPEEVGISSQRLGRLRQQMKTDVESKRIPGAVLLIARNGKVASLDALGFQDRRAQTPMKADSIFRVASMSKPIRSGAALMPSEEGRP